MSKASNDPKKHVEQFYSMVKSLNEFDKTEVRPILQGLISPNDREKCFLGTYYRAVANVETILQLEAKDFQAIAMTARSTFELAVDLPLMDIVPDSVDKMVVFSDVERLRAARKIVTFTSSHPNVHVNSKIYDDFDKAEGTKIDNKQKALWPNLNKVTHWTGLDLASRVEKVKGRFEEMYHVHYAQMSWYVHSGLTGVINLQAETFKFLCGVAFKLAADNYWEILFALIREFKIAKADSKIQGKLDFAKMVPFTDDLEEAEKLLRQLVG